MTLTAGSFDENEAGGQSWGAVEGYLDLVSAVANAQILLQTAGPSNTPLPLPLGSAGPTSGTWDGVTLTIPINSINSFALDSPLGPVPIVIETTGVIIATVRVPEPSSVVLCGFGVVGLLSYAARARKRRASLA